MRWPWARRSRRFDESVRQATEQARASTREAEAATEQAEMTLQRLQRQRPVVEANKAAHREERRVNNLGALMRRHLRGST